MTGATSGIGKAVAQMLAEEGAHVIATGRDKSRLASVAKQLRSGISLAADLSDPDEVEELFRAVESEGPLDVLVSAAGTFRTGRFSVTTDADWADALDVNVMASVRLCRRFLNAMMERGHGRILLVASEAAVRPSADNVMYAVSKAAQVALGRGLAEVAKGSGVAVNTLLVGATWTEGAQAYQAARAEVLGKPLDQHLADYFDNRGSDSLVRRFLDVREVASVAVFYCSDRASAVSGAPVRVDGGILRNVT